MENSGSSHGIESANPASAPLRVALFQYSIRFPVYEEIFTALRDSLAQAGAQVRMVESYAEVTPDRDDLLLIVGTANYTPHPLEGLTALRARHGRAVSVFVWHLEHLPNPETPAPELWALLLKNWLGARKDGGQYGNSRAGNYHILRRGSALGLFDQVFTFTPRKNRFLEDHGVPAEYLPSGHHPVWGTPGSRERDIDVLFLGEVKKEKGFAPAINRRTRIVNAIREELAQAGVVLKTMNDFSLTGIWGAERNAIVQRAKIYLCIYRFPADFSGTRFSLGIGNGAMIVSEPVADPFPFVAGEHFIQAPIRELAQTVLRYLRDDAARERICRQAEEVLAREFTMQGSAERIVTRARELAAQRLS